MTVETFFLGWPGLIICLVIAIVFLSLPFYQDYRRRRGMKRPAVRGKRKPPAAASKK